MNVATDLSGVIAQSMCIGCGVCEHADPSVTVRLHPKKLIFEPDGRGNADAAGVCPAVRVDFADLQARLFPGAEPTEYGVVESVMLAQSTDRDRNLKASSGGIIKELLLELLSRDDVDGAIALGHVGGIEFEPQLLTQPDDVDRLPGSIYHNLSQSKALEILKRHDGRFVLVAIPCQLEGLYNYISRMQPELAERIHTTIGLLCGWQYSHHALKAICEFKGLDFDLLEDISYRGEGPVGKMRVVAGGKEALVSRRVDFEYQVAFDRSFNTPRCHLCIDHSNFLADIVVGDAWLPSTIHTKTGISLVINRRAETEKLMRDLAARGSILVSDVSVEEIKESQKPRIAFGDFAYAYAQYLDELGLHRPDMTGPNVHAANLVSKKEVAFFHRELMRKLELQWAGRYRYLKRRKATKELRRFLARYVEWFLVRVVKIKSLLGQRRELPKEKVRIFR